MKKKIISFFGIIICLCTLIIGTTFAAGELKDGTYSIAATMTGGSGRVTVESPATLYVSGGQISARIVFVHTENNTFTQYSYVILNGQKYSNEEVGNSTFTIPVSALDTKIDIIGHTEAMSSGHDIKYTIYFDSTSLPAEAFVAAAEETTQAPETTVAETTVAETTTATTAADDKDVMLLDDANSEDLARTTTAPEEGKSNTTLIIGIVCVVAAAVVVIALIYVFKIKPGKASKVESDSEKEAESNAEDSSKEDDMLD